MRISLVVNAASGSVSGDRSPSAIHDKLTAAGFDIVPEPDADAALPARIEAAAAQPGIDALVVAGGDGTIACAGGVMAARDLPLGLLPLGTMNMLAKDLGLPLDLDAAIATIRDGAPRRIDVGEVNGAVFLIVSVLGMPTRLAKHRERLRGGFDLRGALRWGLGLMRHLGRYPRLTITSSIDGVERQLRVRMLAVVNNDFIERPGHVMVRHPLDGGRLTLYVVRNLSLWRTLRLSIAFVLGDWRRLPELERHAVTDLTIDARRTAVRVMNDGEVQLLDAPLRFRVRRQALAVIVPREVEAGG